jgi:uncharacterized protein
MFFASPLRLAIFHHHLLPAAPVVSSCEDCACAAATANLRSSHHPVDLRLSWRDAVYAAPPELLWLQNLPLPFSGIFNPQGDGGVVVVNSPARQVFDFFRTPQKAFNLVEYFPDYPQNELSETVALFQQLGLLLENGAPRPRQTQPSTKLTAWLHVTDACNLACPYCYLNKSGQAMDDAIGFAAVEAVFRSAIAEKFKIVKLKYAGGEATLNFPLVIKLHDYATQLAERKQLGLEAVILSNGAALTDKRIQEIKKRNIRVMISLDGLGEHHDVQRPFVSGRGSFLAVSKSIDRLIEADHKPHLSITITSRNIDGVAEVVKFALDRELTFSLNFYRENECSTGFADLRYNEAQMIEGILKTFRVIEENLPPWSILGSVLDRGQLVEARMRPCGVGQDYLVINHLGGVAKCHMEIEKTVTDVRVRNPLATVRADLNGAQNPSVEEKEGCRDCQWRYWCTGGCPVATFKATGRYDVKSPNCNIYKAIYPEALRLEALRLLKYCPQYLA